LSVAVQEREGQNERREKAWATFAASLLAALAAALAVFASFKVAESQARIADVHRLLDAAARRQQGLIVARGSAPSTL